MSTETLKKVDHAAMKTNQIIIILLSLAAFIFNLPEIALFTATMMALGVLFAVPGFVLVYRHVALPLKWIKPDVLADNPEPHRFAQSIGAVFLGASGLASLLGAGLLGWILVWIVIGLAALNAFAGFCVGCAMYYWIGRLRVPGFGKVPPKGTFPGMKPKRSSG